MSASLRERLDQFFRGHPRLMLGVTLLVAIMTTLILVGISNNQEVIYRFF